jgi:hypothetical protein
MEGGDTDIVGGDTVGGEAEDELDDVVVTEEAEGEIVFRIVLGEVALGEKYCGDVDANTTWISNTVTYIGNGLYKPG